MRGRRVEYAVRVASGSDVPALQAALAWAIDWRSAKPSVAAAARIAETGHTYLLADWGRAGDTAVVAECGSQAIGLREPG